MSIYIKHPRQKEIDEIKTMLSSLNMDMHSNIIKHTEDQIYDLLKEVNLDSEEYKRFDRNMHDYIVPLIDCYIINGERSYILIELAYFAEYILGDNNPEFEYLKSLIQYWAQSNNISVRIVSNDRGFMLSNNPLVWFDVKFSLGDE